MCFFNSFPVSLLVVEHFPVLEPPLHEEDEGPRGEEDVDELNLALVFFRQEGVQVGGAPGEGDRLKKEKKGYLDLTLEVFLPCSEAPGRNF